MIVSSKDGLKLLGIVIISCCAVFVCTFFLNYYLDVRQIRPLLSAPSEIALYDAQNAMAKATCAVSGGCLSIIAIIMLIFYVGIYIGGHVKQLGILKAMGWSEKRLAARFWIFGLSVLIGTALGFGSAFIAMPTIYKSLCGDELPAVAISFHPVLLICLVVAPTIIFSLLSCFYAYFKLRRPVGEMLRGEKQGKKSKSKNIKDSERAFLAEMRISSVRSKKMLAFFVAFSCFCFSAMVQMSIAMQDLSSSTMGILILVIGLILAATTIVMAITSLVNGNIKNISIMKAFGYSMRECAGGVLGFYRVFALIGFIVGTAYQYVLLKLMINLIFKDVGYGIEYNFSVKALLITFAAFIVCFEAVMAFYTLKMSKISVKEVMTEN